MSTKNPRKTAILNRLKILQFIHRFGWLRTRDLACLVWLLSRRGDPNEPPDFQPASATGSALRMAQRTIRSLLESGFLLQTKAPDGALVYSLSQTLLYGMNLRPGTNYPKAVKRRFMA